MTEEHKFHQAANDWIMCKCGKIFKNEKQLERHIENELHRS